jgi:hypothetical protein
MDKLHSEAQPRGAMLDSDWLPDSRYSLYMSASFLDFPDLHGRSNYTHVVIFETRDEDRVLNVA